MPDLKLGHSPGMKLATIDISLKNPVTLRYSVKKKKREDAFSVFLLFIFLFVILPAKNDPAPPPPPQQGILQT